MKMNNLIAYIATVALWLVSLYPIYLISEASIAEQFKETILESEHSLTQLLDITFAYSESIKTQMISNVTLATNDQLSHPLSKQLKDFPEINSYGLVGNESAFGKPYSANLTGIGPLSSVSKDILNEINAAIALDLSAPLNEGNHNFIWSYYTSNNGFMLLSPRVGIKDFHFEEYMYGKPFWKIAMPENNPDKRIVISDLYDDAAGQGHMVSISNPVYFKKEFLGVISFDVGVTYLQQIVGLNTHSNERELVLVCKEGAMVANRDLKDIGTVIEQYNYRNIASYKVAEANNKYYYSSNLIKNKFYTLIELSHSEMRWLLFNKMLFGTIVSSLIVIALILYSKLLHSLKLTRERTLDLQKINARSEQLNALMEGLIISRSFDQKLKIITDGIVNIFDADFARIWIMKPGDRCDSGCMHAEISKGQESCKFKDKCLHLMSSSGRYIHIDGKAHGRVPFGCYKIGQIAAGDATKLLTNDIANDPRIHDRKWAKKNGLASFAGYQLLSEENENIGIMALFSKHTISSNEDLLLTNIANTTSQVIQTAKVEEALLKSEALLNAIVENIPDMIFVKDAKELRFVRFNKAGEELLGYSREELIGENDYDLSSKEETVFFTGKDRTVLDNGKLLDIPEEQVLTKYKGERILHTKKIPLLDEEGKPQYLLGISEDITARKQAEAELWEEHERTRTYLDLAGVMFVAIDAADTVTLVNRKACKVLGYVEDEIVGRNWFETCLPQRLRETVKKISKQVLSGEMEPVEYYENPVLTKTGEERLIAWHNTVLRDDEGAIIGHISSGDDITKRKQAEEALSDSENKYRTLFESSIDAIMMLEPPDWKFRAANLSSIKMFMAKDEQNFISKEPWSLSPEYQPDGELSSVKANKMIDKAVSEGSNFFEWVHKRLNGEDFPATVLLSRIELEGTQLLQATVRDITDRKRVEEDRERLIGELNVLATMDPLTDIPNRRCFFDQAEKELVRSKRYNHPFALLMLDIDLFKKINDNFGHDIGDQALKEFAALLKKQTRQTDILGRFGGEEFILLLPETNKKDAESFAQRIIESCRALIVKTSTEDCRFTVSAGLTHTNDSDKKIVEIINRADEALYKAKENGRDQFKKIY